MFFTIVLLYTSCREDFGNLDVYNNVTGEVADEETLEPIPNAKISTNPVTELRISDEFGRFVLDSLTSSIYSIKVVVDGYQSTLTSFNIEDLDNNKILILMERDSVVLSPPEAPFNPFPSQNSEQQDLEINLRWSSSDDNDSLLYTVLFFRPDNITPEKIIAESLDTSVVVRDLSFNSTYFWQVEVTDSDGLKTLGPTWNFKTKEFPSDIFRYTFVRKVNGIDQVFVGSPAGEYVQITYNANNHWRPTFSPQRDKIAYLSLLEGDVHILMMDRNGDNVNQVTSTRPLRTKDILETPFTWSENGERLIYMDFDRIFSITRNGTGLLEYGFQAFGDIISSVDYSSIDGGKLVVTTERPSGNDSKLYLYDIALNEQVEILDSLNGQLSHAQFSPSGRQIVFTYNELSSFSTDGIPLNKRIYYYDLDDEILLDISDRKAGGTADYNPRFSNNGANIVFNNNQSDGIGQSSTFIMDVSEVLTDSSPVRDTLFTNSNMIDWE
ncbi:hypothetical protein GCM10007940_37750 [Portibacter lacus]|uniref:Fibronectin type-III domain-containing protein n=2 Tax=Portibacter lacus TaxID=1099794 RepID=A0AA37ST26_9BACT|nr:hypothetical protein GCM10007940_37750 [Portibacter lacus]